MIFACTFRLATGQPEPIFQACFGCLGQTDKPYCMLSTLQIKSYIVQNVYSNLLKPGMGNFSRSGPIRSLVFFHMEQTNKQKEYIQNKMTQPGNVTGNTNISFCINE